MIHLKQVHVNCSYFPDDYDDTKEKQDYEDQDNHLRYFIPMTKLPEFFRELLLRWYDEMNTLVYDYFEFINSGTPIFCDTITIKVNGNIVEFCYDLDPDIEDEYSQLKSESEHAILDWIRSFSANKVKERLAMFLATQITLKYANIVNGVAGAEQDYTNFMRIIANCLDLSLDGFYEELESCCDHGDYNTWLDFEYKDEDTEDDIASHLTNAFSANALWLACIYTSKFTSFVPDNF